MADRSTRTRQAYYALVDAYLEVLGRVDRLPRVHLQIDVDGPDEKASGFRRLLRALLLIPSMALGFFSLQPLLRYLVENHSLGRLREVRSACVQWMARTPPESTRGGRDRAWVESVLPELDALTGTFTSWKSLVDSAASLAAGGAGLLLALLGLNEAGEILPRLTPLLEPYLGKSATAALPLLFALVLAAVLCVNVVAATFDLKRRLFLRPGPGRRPVYDLEDELFGSLGRRKTPEFPVDVWARGALIFGIPALAYGLDALWRGSPADSLFTDQGKITVFGICLVFYAVTIHGWRRGRRM